MPDLSFQLFSARKTALPDALQIIADAGYSSVEAYGENFSDMDLFKSSLDAHSLTITSVHIGLDQLANNMSDALSTANAFNIDHIVCPFLLPEERPTERAGWEKLALHLAGISDVLQKNGKTFAWHNHDFEVIPLGDGSVPLQILLDHAPEMHLELDLGWVHRAGGSPEVWLQKYAKRISAIHIKDVAAAGECLDEDGWADAGHGTMDWVSLVTAIKKTSATLLVAEHDNPSDLQRFANNSFNAVQGWDWS